MVCMWRARAQYCSCMHAVQHVVFLHLAGTRVMIYVAVKHDVIPMLFRLPPKPRSGFRSICLVAGKSSADAAAGLATNPGPEH